MGVYGAGVYGAGTYGGGAPIITYPDAMPDIRSWLRNHPYLADLSAGRVFFSIPPKIKTAPFIRIYRSGGGPQGDPGDAPISDLRVAIEAWGMHGKDYTIVRQTILAIEAAAHDLDPGTPIGDGTILLNVNITTALDIPDPDTGWPRIMADAIFTVRL